MEFAPLLDQRVPAVMATGGDHALDVDRGGDFILQGMPRPMDGGHEDDLLAIDDLLQQDHPGGGTVGTLLMDHFVDGPLGPIVEHVRLRTDSEPDDFICHVWPPKERMNAMYRDFTST